MSDELDILGEAYATKYLPDKNELVAKTLELGLVMRRAPAYDVTHPALTLTPFSIHRNVLHELYERQLLWNEAVDRTARQYQLLDTILKETADSDTEFTGNLLEILRRVYLPHENNQHKPVFQPLMLGIFRTDYMRSIDEETGEEETASQWKNVEINTISCSFAGLSPLVGKFQNYLKEYKNCFTASHQRESREVEQSVSGEAIPEALALSVKAWKDAVPLHDFETHYQQTQNTASTPLIPIVLVVIQENERNTGDQYRLLFQLFEQYGIISVRRTHQEVYNRMELIDFGTDAQRKAPFMVLEKRYVVAVAYFRSAYVPSDYDLEVKDTNGEETKLLPFDKNPRWLARLELERSNSIKCPSIPYHLLTFKKLQQVMTNVQQFLVPYSFGGGKDAEEKAAVLSQHFMAQYSLNEKEYEQLSTAGETPETYIQRALEAPAEYVLKPQLEGGGNLIAGEEMVRALSMTATENPKLYHKVRKEYILMKKIHYPKKSGLLFRNENFFFLKNNVCSELGIYGTILSDGSGKQQTSSLNRQAGYVIRTKPADVEDGGVMAGVACLDSALLL